jgi:hypothetical protein
MTQQLTKIYDLSYAISGNGEEVRLEQLCGYVEEPEVVILNRIHLKLLAEKTGLIEPDNTARMGKLVRDELNALLDAIQEHWDDLANHKDVELDCLVQARTLFEKANTLCRIAGCFEDKRAENAESMNKAWRDGMTPDKGLGSVSVQGSLVKDEK